MSKAGDMTAARRKAQELLGRNKQKEAERIAVQDKERAAQDAKIAKLRELRLAREAGAAKPVPPTLRPARRKPA